MDADNDGIADRVDLDPNDASIQIERPNLSDYIDEIIGAHSNLDSVESKIAFGWMQVMPTEMGIRALQTVT